MGQVYQLPKRYHEVSETQVRAAVVEAGLRFRTTSRSFDIEVCPWCEKTPGKNPTKKSELYSLKIFRDTGHAHCFHCDYQGSFFRWTREMNVFDMYVKKYSQPQKPQKTFAKAAQYKVAEDRKTIQATVPHEITRELEPNPVLSWLMARGLKPHTVERYGIGARLEQFRSMEEGNEQSYTHWCASFPYYASPDAAGKTEVVRYKIRSVHEKRSMRIDPAGSETVLFGLQLLDFGVRDVVLTEGEIDAATVWQETGVQAVSLPNGGNGLQGDFLDVLDGFDCIYLWLDDDETGRKAKDFILNRFGRARCKIVNPMDEEGRKAKDANHALQQGMNLSRMLQDADFEAPEGFVTLSTMKKAMQDFYMNTRVGVKYDGLDKFSAATGGHRGGELWIWTGLSGKGKTTVLAQITQNLLMKGHKVCWGSFEIQKEIMVNTILQQIIGKDYQAVFKNALEHNYDQDYMEGLGEKWVNEVWEIYNHLPLSFITSHHEMDIEQILGVMRYARLAQGVRCFVLDNLQFMYSGVAGSDKMDQYELCIKKLREFKDTYDAHIDLVVHPVKAPEARPLTLGSVGTRASTTQEADMVVAVQRHDENKSYLEILKNRYNGKLGKFEYEFDHVFRTIREAEGAVIKRTGFGTHTQKKTQQPSWLGT